MILYVLSDRKIVILFFFFFFRGAKRILLITFSLPAAQCSGGYSGNTDSYYYNSHICCGVSKQVFDRKRLESKLIDCYYTGSSRICISFNYYGCGTFRINFIMKIRSDTSSRRFCVFRRALSRTTRFRGCIVIFSTF